MLIWGKCLRICPLRTSSLLVVGQTRADVWFLLVRMKRTKDAWQVLGNHPWVMVQWVWNQFWRTEEILLGQI